MNKEHNFLVYNLPNENSVTEDSSATVYSGKVVINNKDSTTEDYSGVDIDGKNYKPRMNTNKHELKYISISDYSWLGER